MANFLFSYPAIAEQIRRYYSETQPAKILVFMVKDKDKPATRAAQ